MMDEVDHPYCLCISIGQILEAEKAKCQELSGLVDASGMYLVFYPF